MSLRIANTLRTRLFQETSSSLLAPISQTNLQFVRETQAKHWNPKWKFLRRLKVMKVDLPNLREQEEDLTDEQIRSKLKEQGLLPPRPWIEKPFFISSTGGVFEEYVPPEGDGKISPINVQGAKQKIEYLEKKSKTMMAVRKIRSFEEEFDTTKFCEEAHKIYLKMNELMSDKNEEELIQYVTERAYPEVIHNIKNKTIRWKFIKNIELPRVVHARCTDVVSKENIFAQLTVRFHTQQSLAIYDRFGRLMHGSEILAKDVLEYVVFEKHVANEYGTWRIHAKIIPDWLPPREPSAVTYIRPSEEVAVDAKALETKPATVASLEPPQEKPFQPLAA